MKDIFKASTIGKKFLIPSLIFTVILFFLLAVVNLRGNASVMRSQMEARGNAMANYMAKTSVFYYYNYDLGALDGFIKEVVKNKDVAYAVFYDENKEPVTASSNIPKDTSGLLVYDREVKDADGNVLGYLSLGYSQRALSESVRKLGLIMGLSTVLTLLAITFGIIFAVRKLITNPLNGAVALANRLSEGDLTTEIKAERNDEIGVLLKAMGNMVDRLKELMMMITDSTLHVNSSTSDISSSVEQQAAIASEQSSSVMEITATMEELSVSSTQIADNANSVVATANNTLEDTKKGAFSVKTFISKMEEIYEDNQSSIKEIVDLGRKSKEITKVMEIINNIADQTKLIAFNAALEASSAGEAGKRFGVVASEIRRLADSVMDSTSEIEAKINEIQEAVNRLVIASEKGSKGIREGMEFSHQTGRLLTQIVAGAESTTSSAKQISLSTQQQKTASEQVVVALREIAEGATQGSESIQQINVICKDLSSLSNNMRKIVEQFKLGSHEGGS